MSVSKICEKKGLNWNYRCDRNPEKIIKKIGKKKSYFCFQVKGNQKTLKEDIEDYFADKGFRRKWKKAGTEKVLHNEYSRGSGRICKSGKRTLGNRKLSLDTGCD